jgi:hypothetical protein
MASLAEYAYDVQNGFTPDHQQIPKIRRNDGLDIQGERKSSALLLRILSSADYFTDDVDLMRNVPLVHVDIILDPYFLNVLPQSLVPTTGYLAIIATLSYFIAGRIASSLHEISNPKAKGNIKIKQ